MKTLLKIANGKHIPVLCTVKVQMGIAETTDMDLTIRYPAEQIEDSLYHAIGFDKAGLRRKAEMDIDDFPTRLEPGQSLGSLTLDIADLEYVSRAMSREDTRYYRCGICFLGCDMVAIDGHRLHKVPLTEAVPENNNFRHGMIAPAAAVKAAISAAKEEKTTSIKVTFYAEWVAIQVARYSLVTKFVDGNYPMYERTIPMGYTKHTTFKLEEFFPIAKEVKVLMKQHDCKIPGVALHGNKVHAFGKSWTVSTCIDVKIGFRIPYLIDTHDGILSYSDNSQSPITIEKREFGMKVFGGEWFRW